MKVEWPMTIQEQALTSVRAQIEELRAQEKRLAEVVAEDNKHRERVENMSKEEYEKAVLAMLDLPHPDDITS